MKYITAVLLGMFVALGMMTTNAISQTIGDKVKTYGFCVGKVAARRMTEAMRADGVKGYTKVLQDVNTRCFDMRFHGPATVGFLTVQIIEKVWIAKLPDGKQYQFYRVKDKGTDQGYIWRLIPDELT